MSMRKSSMITGAPAKKTVDWTEVPDEELATDLDDTDLVGDAKAWEKHRRLCVARDAEICRAEEAHREVKRKCQAEEVERCRKGEEERQQKEAEAEQKQKDKKAKQAAAAKARKWQWADSEVQASRSQANVSVCIRCARLKLTCVIPAGIKKRSACGLCMKAKEWCEWPEVEMMVSSARMSPQGREHRKWAKKVANDDDDDEIVILSGRKTKWQGGSETLEEISDRSKHGTEQWLQDAMAPPAHGGAGSGGVRGIIKDPEELQGEGSGGQEGDTEGVPGGAPEDEPGDEPENGAGEEGQKRDKGKGKEKAL
ncbi:hypothetical protein ID866_11347 [Astraeus odoratus]|nr:hypothetical protein ID866_11347 [Astraeus odoratus]